MKDVLELPLTTGDFLPVDGLHACSKNGVISFSVPTPKPRSKLNPFYAVDRVDVNKSYASFSVPTPKPRSKLNPFYAVDRVDVNESYASFSVSTPKPRSKLNPFYAVDRVDVNESYASFSVPTPPKPRRRTLLFNPFQPVDRDDIKESNTDSSTPTPKPRKRILPFNPLYAVDRVGVNESAPTTPKLRKTITTFNPSYAVHKVEVKELNTDSSAPKWKPRKSDWRMKRMETNLDDHLHLTLLGCGLDMYHANFQNHHISYLDFLRLEENDLEGLGIINADHRSVIWRKICDISSTSTVDNARQKVARLSTHITYATRVNIITNVTDQLSRIAETHGEYKYLAIDGLYKLIMENLLNLDNGANSQAVDYLISTTDSVQESGLLLEKEINRYISKLMQNKGGGREVKTI